jgi:excisionase family DNA binding protein
MPCAKRKDAMQSKTDSEQRRYVTVQDAAEHLNIAERTVFRMIKQQRLKSMKAPNGSRWVSLEDVEYEQQAKPHSASPAHSQLQHTQALVAQLQETMRKLEDRLQTLEQQMAMMQHCLINVRVQEGIQEEVSRVSGMHDRCPSMKKRHDDDLEVLGQVGRD